MMVVAMAEFQERFARHFNHVRWIVSEIRDKTTRFTAVSGWHGCPLF